MKSFLLITFLVGLSLFTVKPEIAQAQSCYDLWYQRNAVYDAYGYCFTSSLGRRVFDNSDCSTSNPRLSRVDRQYVQRIQREERRRGCRVNR